MQDRPHRRLNLTQPYGQANGSTLIAPETDAAHSPEPERLTPQSAASAVEPLVRSGEGSPAYLVVPLDSANEALVSALREPSSADPSLTTPLATSHDAGRNWLFPALGGMVVGAVVVGIVAYRGSSPRSVSPVTTTAAATATAPASRAAPAKAARQAVHAVVRGDATGAFSLTAAGATTHGEKIRQAPDAIGYWDGTDSYVTWAVETPRAGKYRVGLTYALQTNCGGPFVVQAGKSRIATRSRSTGSWIAYRTIPLGMLTLTKGRTTVSVRPNGKPATALMNLRMLRLAPAPTGKGVVAKGGRGAGRS